VRSYIKFHLNQSSYFFIRSNTSILAQKKKNQKKKASRKRALDRRHSEGSESEKHDDEFDEKVSCLWMKECQRFFYNDFYVCSHRMTKT
jgi:hypothetical protein